MQAIQGDITTLKVGAIVNAANTSLLGGGGVDGAIHRTAGPELLEACRKLNGCRTGDAKITEGFNLPARFVIHTVGPVWHGGNRGEPDLLARCYQNSLNLVKEYQLQSVAFPCISTGVYGYPLEEAASIAVRISQNFLKQNGNAFEVIFCCFQESDYEIYQRLLEG